MSNYIDSGEYIDPIEDFEQYVQNNLPKKYLDAFPNEKMDKLIEQAYDDCFEMRSAGGLEDPPGYIGEEPYEGPIPSYQAYRQLLENLEEIEKAALIITLSFKKRKETKKKY
jgi:hypothetical protein